MYSWFLLGLVFERKAFQKLQLVLNSFHFVRLVQFHKMKFNHSSGSSGRVERVGGRETLNLCGRIRWPSFFTGPFCWIRYWISNRYLIKCNRTKPSFARNMLYFGFLLLKPVIFAQKVRSYFIQRLFIKKLCVKYATLICFTFKTSYFGTKSETIFYRKAIHFLWNNMCFSNLALSIHRSIHNSSHNMQHLNWQWRGACLFPYWYCIYVVWFPKVWSSFPSFFLHCLNKKCFFF